MKNNLGTIGSTNLIVRLIYLVQVVRIETDYCFPLAAQDEEMLEAIQWLRGKKLSPVAHI